MTKATVNSTTAKKAVPRLTSAFQQLMSLHWIMSWGYFILFATGYIMTNWIPEKATFRGSAYGFHKGLGALVLALITWRVFLLLRVWWKKYSRRLPKFSAEWWSKTALHTLLYVFMWAVPLTGFFLSNSFKANNVKIMGIVLPDLFPENKALVDVAGNMHFWFSYAFLAFVIVHMVHQRKVVKAISRRWLQALSPR
ncbi:MAG: cytochrome b/b6 domain-containing protein [Snowella sp.]|nr:cytochrome b/b6 domain-containing protein [Snowella sp.]